MKETAKEKIIKILSKRYGYFTDKRHEAVAKEITEAIHAEF